MSQVSPHKSPGLKFVPRRKAVPGRQRAQSTPVSNLPVDDVPYLPAASSTRDSGQDEFATPLTIPKRNVAKDGSMFKPQDPSLRSPTRTTTEPSNAASTTQESSASKEAETITTTSNRDSDDDTAHTSHHLSASWNPPVSTSNMRSTATSSPEPEEESDFPPPRSVIRPPPSTSTIASPAPRTQREIEEEAAVEHATPSKGGAKRKPRAKSTAQKKTPVVPPISEALEGEPENGEDETDARAPFPKPKSTARKRKASVIPPSQAVKKAKAATLSAKAKGKQKAANQSQPDNVDDDHARPDEDDEMVAENGEARTMEKKRRKGALASDGSAKRGRVQQNTRAPSPVPSAAPSDSEAASESEADSSDSQASNSLHTPKRTKRKHDADKAAVQRSTQLTVDSSQTKMADIATARDIVGGRLSSRGHQLLERDAERKAKRRKARERQKLLAKLIKGGKTPEEAEATIQSMDAAAKTKAASNDDSAHDGTAVVERSPGVDENEVAESSRSTLRVNPNFDTTALEDDDSEEETVPRPLRPLDPEPDVGSDDDNEDDEDDGELYQENQDAAQISIVDGQLLINEASLQIDRHAQAQASQSFKLPTIEEDPKDRLVNSMTHGRKIVTKKWTQEETDLFYDYLGQFGTDFEMLAKLFPGRTRRQIKSKWTKEDRQNPHLITHALKNRKKIDLEAYAAATGENLAGPVPEDPLEKIQKRREELEAKGVDLSVSHRPFDASATGTSTATTSGKPKSQRARKKEEAARQEARGREIMEQAELERQRAEASDDDDEEDEVDEDEERQKRVDALLAMTEI